MIFFDSKNPNKYSKLKKLLTPCKNPAFNFERYGKGDGSYVLPKNLNKVSLLSYGLGSDPEGCSFEQSFDKKGCVVHVYDASIDEPPVKFSHVSWFKEYLNASNFQRHVKKLPKKPFNILKMDVEGCEYEWATLTNIAIAASNFDALCIEIHGLIEEEVEGWVYPEPLLKAKREKLAPFLLESLNRFFTPWHLHANNHSPRYVDFPDSLEVTYLSTRGPLFVADYKFPIDGLDFPNYNGREDYVLDWWL